MNSKIKLEAPDKVDSEINNFAELLESSLANIDLKVGSIIKGSVIDIKEKERLVFIDVGLKSVGIVPVNQFHDGEGNLEIAVGDEVEVVLEAIEDGFGQTRLSREKAKRVAAWNRLVEAQEDGTVVQGRVTNKVKGGFTIDVDSIKAFLPGSLIDFRPLKDTDELEGQVLSLKVVSIDAKRNNVVVSRKAVLAQEYSEDRKAILENLQEGQIIKGIVKNITNYGAFIDLGGGVDALLHLTDISWGRTKHPSEKLEIGDEIEVKVLKYDQERERVSVGLKQLTADPWTNIGERYATGSKIQGKVTNITDYGCFVEIEDGIEGLVHSSEIDWKNKNINPDKVVSLGQEVNVVIISIEEERRRISLSIKQGQDNPWQNFANTHTKNDRINGKIKSITDFGIFIGLPGNIDGLIHLSDISWDISGEEAIKQYKKGEEVEAVVLAIDAGRERISLGIKQLNADPFNDYITANPKGTLVQGKVVEVNNKQAVIMLADKVEGILKANAIADSVNDAKEHLTVDQEISAQIVAIDRKGRIVQLSIKAKEDRERKETVKSYSQNQDISKSNTTLGDLLKEKMNAVSNNKDNEKKVESAEKSADKTKNTDDGNNKDT